MYPFQPLREAIERVQTLWQHEKRNAVPVPVAASHWNYAAKSSGAFQTISALKQFGLLTDEGSGDKRSIRLSDAALGILREESSSEAWLSRIRAAAISPPIHAELWKKFGTEASDKNIQTYLVFDRKFTEASATSLIKEYRDTIAFAQLGDSDTLVEPESTEESQMNQTATIEPPPLNRPPPLSTGGSIREFAVPLPSGAIGAFKIPFPMSEADFTQYSALLEAYKTAIVKKSSDGESE